MTLDQAAAFTLDVDDRHEHGMLAWTRALNWIFREQRAW